MYSKNKKLLKYSRMNKQADMFFSYTGNSPLELEMGEMLQSD